MELPETGITRWFYESASTSKRRLIVSNRGRAKLEKSIFSIVRVVLLVPDSSSNCEF